MRRCRATHICRRDVAGAYMPAFQPPPLERPQTACIKLESTEVGLCKWFVHLEAELRKPPRENCNSLMKLLRSGWSRRRMSSNRRSDNILSSNAEQ